MAPPIQTHNLITVDNARIQAHTKATSLCEARGPPLVVPCWRDMPRQVLNFMRRSSVDRQQPEHRPLHACSHRQARARREAFLCKPRICAPGVHRTPAGLSGQADSTRHFTQPSTTPPHAGQHRPSLKHVAQAKQNSRSSPLLAIQAATAFVQLFTAVWGAA
jgi:hypothetical protein